MIPKCLACILDPALRDLLETLIQREYWFLKLNEHRGALTLVTWEEWAKTVNDKLTELSNRIDHIARNMALLSQVQSLRQDFNELCDELIDTLFLEPMSEAIIQTLKDTPHLTKAQIVTKLLKPSSRQPLRWHAFYKAWELLEKDLAITAEHHGRGHARTWILNEEEKELDQGA